MKHVYGYIRVSDPKQGAGVSLHEQKEAIVRYAQKNGLHIAQWFEEIKTAAKSGRPQFVAMLKGLRDNNAKGVIIHKIDRSARNLRDWADLAELMDNGVEVHFAHESIDMSARGGRLSADIQAVIASDYIRNLREETLKGIYGRLKQGLYPFRAPLGYLDTGSGNVKEIDPKTAPMVKLLFELYGTNEYSVDELTKEIYKRGLRNRKGGRVTPTGISTILKNSFYIGLINVKEKTFTGKHKPLISPSLFNCVQAILEEKTVMRKVKHDFLFRRHVKCAECKYTLIPEKQKGHVYYRCQTKECSVKCMREEFLESSVENCFSILNLKKNDVLKIQKYMEKLEVDKLTGNEENLKAIRLQLVQLTERMNRLTDALIDGVIDRTAYEEKNKQLLTEKKSLEENKRAYEEDKSHLFTTMKKYLELLKNLMTAYNSGILPERRRLLHSVTSNLITDGKKVYIAMKSPFQELYQDSISDYCPPNNNTTRTAIPIFTHHKNTTLIAPTDTSDLDIEGLVETIFAHVKNAHESNRDYKDNQNNL